MAPANILSILQRVSWSMETMSSVLITMAAGGGALKVGGTAKTAGMCKGNLTNLRRELHLSLAKGNPK
jgi:hypothetical protein